MHWVIITLSVFILDFGTGTTNRETVREVPSFSQTVFPIFQAKCNATACHGPKGFPQYQNHAKIKAVSQKIMKRILDAKNPMPPKTAKEKISKAEIDVIRRWVEAGSPNN